VSAPKEPEQGRSKEGVAFADAAMYAADNCDENHDPWCECERDALALLFDSHVSALRERAQELERTIEARASAKMDEHCEAMERQVCDWLDGRAADTPDTMRRHRDCMNEIIGGLREGNKRLRARLQKADELAEAAEAMLQGGSSASGGFGQVRAALAAYRGEEE
jgi:hypothetical protein